MKISHYLSYGFVMLLKGFLRLLPRPLALWLARKFGSFIHFADARHRRLVARNLDLAYGDDLSLEDKQRIAKQVYQHFTMMIADLVRTPVNDKFYKKYVTIEGAEHLETAHAMGKGTIYLTGHYGNWELFALTVGHLGMPLHALARKLDNPLFEKWLARVRVQTGNEILHKQSAVKASINVLKDNGGVAILVDQNMNPGRGIFVDFFGVPAATSTVVSSIALKLGTPVVPCFVRPEPGYRWRVTFSEPMVFEAGGKPKERIAEVTQELTKFTEEQIRQQPEVWLWMHKRWKTRPSDEEGNIYEGV